MSRTNSGGCTGCLIAIACICIIFYVLEHC